MNDPNLPPGQRAHEDQMRAHVHDRYATNPTTVTVVVTHADPGQQCSWCDCTPGQARETHDKGIDCDGCPRPAFYRIELTPPGAPARYEFPVCGPHQSDATAQIAAGIADAQVR